MKKVTTEQLSRPDSDLDPEVLAFRSQFNAVSPLDELVRQGAQQMLQAAIETEVSDFSFLTRIASMIKVVAKSFATAIFLHGNFRRVPGQWTLLNREFEIIHHKANRVRFSSSILPRYLRRSKSIEELLPWLYLKGISTGDFNEALQSLLGENASNLSPNTIVRLKDKWATEYDDFSRRDLTDKEYVYIWADGIHVNVRLESEGNQRQCMLVLIGATREGKKEFIAITDGYRESEQSWYELLVDLKNRGLTMAPKLAVGDGALGFWAAIRKVYGETREQRCWVHKTANILNKMPKSVQPKAKTDIHNIWMAETRKEAVEAFDTFLEKYQAKYPKACDCLAKDRDTLLTFYDFPAEHWAHLRTTNPIESTFATIRLRHRKTKAYLAVNLKRFVSENNVRTHGL